MVDFKREMEINLGERSFKLKGTFDALSTMQSECGFSMAEITQMLADKKAPLQVYSAIIFGGIVGAGNPEKITHKEVQELVFEFGILGVAPMAVNFFLLCIKKNPKFEGDPEKNAVPAQAGQPMT